MKTKITLSIFGLLLLGSTLSSCNKHLCDAYTSKNYETEKQYNANKAELQVYEAEKI